MTFDSHQLGEDYEFVQDGRGIKGFAGRDMQYGQGLGVFGRMLMRYAKPILKYLGRESLKTGVNIGQDVLDGNPIKEAVASRVKETGSQIASDTVKAVRKKLTGRGKMARRRRRTHKKPVIRRRTTVRRRRVRRKRVKKAIRDIFT